jgi:uncharacterized repeat protein (TIGR01451 family)
MLCTKLALRFLIRCIALLAACYAVPSYAASCSQATSQGTAPPAWQTYCWLDFSTYDDTTAKSASGQNFSYTLSDGATLTFNVKTTSPPAIISIAAPSWTGSAVGNTAFLGIPGRPILYSQAGGTSTFVFSNIQITPPAGVSAVSAYSFVAADAESTNETESITFDTNGSAWTVLDQVNPISGSIYPPISGVGTTTFTETGVVGTVGGYIVGSNSPTTVTTTMVGGGLQGVMFAVRFASIRLNKQITGARVNAADQFNFSISSTPTGTSLASGTTSGTGNGLFSAGVLSLASGIPLTLSETMAPGSVSPSTKYRGSLTCTNGTVGSSTVLPTNLVTTSYNLGALQFGDAIECLFTNTAFPHLTLQKALGEGGRMFDTDQFRINIRTGSTTTATTTTTGTGTTLTAATTPQTQVVAGTLYNLNETASGSTTLSNYTSAMVCTNAAGGSSTVLPTSAPGAITPALGDVITCTITNTRKASNANLEVTKTSAVVSDGISSANPKAIPGAFVRYTITVRNTGNLPVDASTLALIDFMPPGMTYNAGSPVTFTNGTTPSGLNAFNAATMVTYSSQAGGIAPYNYTPIAGYDPNVKGVRIAPTGTMAASTGVAKPSFSVSFLAQVN